MPTSTRETCESMEMTPVTTRSEPRVRRDLFVYLSGPITAAHGYRVEDNVAAGLRVFFDCVARGIPAFKALFMTVWCPDSRSVESNCGIPRG